MLIEDTLRGGLIARTVAAETEAHGIANFADAYGDYAAGAAAAPSAITPAGVAAGKAAMQAAMVGINAPGQGVPKIVSGVIAFWGGVAAGLSASFPGAVAIVPPPFAALAPALATVAALNMGEGASLQTAMGRWAQAIHAQTVIGGVVTYPGPVASPIL